MEGPKSKISIWGCLQEKKVIIHTSGKKWGRKRELLSEHGEEDSLISACSSG